jgi:hypothetical protein
MNQSDMWQYLTRVKPRVTSAEYRGSGLCNAKSIDIKNSEIAICDFVM